MIAVIIVFSSLGYLTIGYIGSVLGWAKEIKKVRKHNVEAGPKRTQHVKDCPLEDSHFYCRNYPLDEDYPTALMFFTATLWPAVVAGAALAGIGYVGVKGITKLTNWLVNLI